MVKLFVFLLISCTTIFYDGVVVAGAEAPSASSFLAAAAASAPKNWRRLIVPREDTDSSGTMLPLSVYQPSQTKTATFIPDGSSASQTCLCYVDEGTWTKSTETDTYSMTYTPAGVPDSTGKRNAVETLSVIYGTGYTPATSAYSCAVPTSNGMTMYTGTVTSSPNDTPIPMAFTMTREANGPWVTSQSIDSPTIYIISDGDDLVAPATTMLSNMNSANYYGACQAISYRLNTAAFEKSAQEEIFPTTGKTCSPASVDDSTTTDPVVTTPAAEIITTEDTTTPTTTPVVTEAPIVPESTTPAEVVTTPAEVVTPEATTSTPAVTETPIVDESSTPLAKLLVRKV